MKISPILGENKPNVKVSVFVMKDSLISGENKPNAKVSV